MLYNYLINYILQMTWCDRRAELMGSNRRRPKLCTSSPRPSGHRPMDASTPN
jgi:hypothetical protein